MTAASRSLLLASGGTGGVVLVPPVSDDWTVPGADDIDAALSVVYSANAFTVTESGITKAEGYRPAAAYGNLWTRDNAYTLWHNPSLRTAAQRRQIVTYTLSKRDGLDFIPDRIASNGSPTYLNPGASALPFLDGIAMVVLLLWADWTETADNSTFVAQQSAIDDCLAAMPRSVNGCVWSDPADPSVDYGFTDSIKKTGDCAYGTALQAWAYKMCDEMSGGGSSTAEGDTYANLRAHAETGLATLRDASGWYVGSSGNNAGVYDVWATALIVAEELVTGANRSASATTIRDAYLADEISERGRVRHLPIGQYWTGTATPHESYQNGGFWNTPLWDCVRAVAVVDFTTAYAWAVEAMTEIADDELAVYGAAATPNEWLLFPYGVVGGAAGYTPSAAVVHRFI